MAKLTKTAFYTKWHGLFADNKAGLISEARMRQFAQDIKDSFTFQGEVGTLPEVPPEVEWVQVPGITIVGETLTESAASIKVSGQVKPILAQEIFLPYAGKDKKRLDAIVLDYLAPEPVYIRIPGKEVGIYESAGRETIPANYLFVNDVEVTDGEIKPSASGAIKKISINGGPTFAADPTGWADIKIELEGGGHIILNDQGAPMEQRGNLQFMAGDNVSIDHADDGAGDTTIITLSVQLPDFSIYATNENLTQVAQGVVEAIALGNDAYGLAETAQGTAQGASEIANYASGVAGNAINSANEAYQIARVDWIPYRFDDVDLDDYDRIEFTRKIEVLGAVSTGPIQSITYQVGAVGTDGVSVGTPAEINTWINSNYSTGVKYFIEVHQLPTVGGVGYAQHVFKIANL